MHIDDFPPDPYAQIGNFSYIPEERLEEIFQQFQVVPPEACFSISRTRETNFIGDFIQKTLFVMQNGFWYDLDWEPTVLQLFRAHKLESLLTCIINLGTHESAKLGKFLVNAVCHRHQDKFNANDLHSLLLCGCKLSKKTLRAAYRLVDIQKIQYLFQFSDTTDWDISKQCESAVEQGLPAIFEVLELLAARVDYTAVLGSLKSDWRNMICSTAWKAPDRQQVLLKFNTQNKSDFEFKLQPILTGDASMLACWARRVGTVINLPLIEMLMKAINSRHENVIGMLSSEMKSVLKKPGYLLFAVSMGDEATTEWLLNAGANPNGRSSILGVRGLERSPRSSSGEQSPQTSKVYSVTPLSIAIRSNLGKIIERLLLAGADPSLTASIPPLYWCTGNNQGCRWTSECEYLKTQFEEISPLELAIIRGCEAAILRKLWVPGIQFRQPERAWMFLLMYTQVGSPEFDFAVESLLISQFGWSLADLLQTRRSRRFKLRWDQSMSDPEYNLLLESPRISPSQVAFQTYDLGRFISMIHHAINCRGESHRETIMENMAKIGDKWAIDTGFHVLRKSLSRNLSTPPRDKLSRQRSSSQALAYTGHAQKLRWDLSFELRGLLLSSIIKSAWRGDIGRPALHEYLSYLSEYNELDSRLYPAVIQILRQTGQNIIKLFVESIDKSEAKGLAVLDENSFELFEYFIEIGWDINETACSCGDITALDVILDKCTPNSTTFAIIKRLCDAGARINHGARHYSALSHAISARRRISRVSFDAKECWALSIIELIIQVEKQSGHIHDEINLQTKVGIYLATPLQEAAYYGDIKLAGSILRAGLDSLLEVCDIYTRTRVPAFLDPCSEPGVWSRDLKGHTPEYLSATPLELAVIQGRQDMVVFLLQAGAKVTDEIRRQAQPIPRILRLLPDAVCSDTEESDDESELESPRSDPDALTFWNSFFRL
ncbi:hypothetical protein TWF506_002624 [Arthrobotrys conoides]|uniref:Ankyrin n=1 Tax=Arthrobotrys conoides TaxID=74498 RepID=A0AAN8NIL2_9PEZI